MAFSASEIAEHSAVIEKVFWSQCRPPLQLRDQILEGQRIADHTIELFYVRPRFQRPQEACENPIAKIRFFRSRETWQLYWQRANGKWELYMPYPEADSLAELLVVIAEDDHGCFFG